MSYHDYYIGLKIHTQYTDDDFYGILQAAMRLADDNNRDKLKRIFPKVWADLKARHDAPNGILPEDNKI